jgi:hypothetical protein
MIQKHAKPVSSSAGSMGEDGVERYAASLPVLAHDPAFTLTDEAVLARFRVQAVGGSEAVRDLGPDVLLFASFTEINILIPHIVRGAKPGLYFGTDIKGIFKVLSAQSIPRRKL